MQLKLLSGGIGGFTWFVIGEILFFFMREFKILFYVTCDGSISRDAWCFKFIFCEVWWDHLISEYTWLIPNFPYLKYVGLTWMLGGICDVGILISYDLWLDFFISRDLWWTPPNTPPPLLTPSLIVMYVTLFNVSVHTGIKQCDNSKNKIVRY